MDLIVPGAAGGAAAGDLDYHDASLSPVVLYNFNGDLLDSSGNGLALTQQQGTTQYAQYGNSGKKCAFFDGSTAFWESTKDASLIITGDLTVAAMVNIGPAAVAGGGFLVDKGATGATSSNNDNYLCAIAPAKLYMLWRHGNKVAAQTTQFNVGVVRGEWAHAAWVRSGTTAKLYVNGILGHTEDLLNAATGGTVPNLRIGRYQESGSGYHFTGYAASIGIWASALTDAQILGMAQQCLGI